MQDKTNPHEEAARWRKIARVLASALAIDEKRATETLGNIDSIAFVIDVELSPTSRDELVRLIGEETRRWAEVKLPS